MKRRVIKRLTSPGDLAVFLYRIAHRLNTPGQPRLMPKLLTVLNRFLTGIEIAAGAELGRGVRFKHGMGTVIGAWARIGVDCVIFHNVTIGSAGPGTGMPVVGDRVVLYAGAVLVGDITVGDGAVVGANAVVTRDVPAGATVAGVPARVVRGPGVEAAGYRVAV